ncbi:MAG: helix-turn-helix domain-containing protein [Halioglobus sp.]
MNVTAGSLSIASRDAQESRIAANWLHRLERCLGDEGAPLFRDALRETGISQNDIHMATNIHQAQLDQVSRFLRADVPDITLRMFAIAELIDLGLTGYAAVNSDSVGRAMNVLYQYHSLTSDRYNDQLERVGEMAIVTTTPFFNHLHDLQNIVEDSFMGNWRCLEILLGSAFDPGRVRLNFQHPAPAYLATYESCFKGARLNFEAENNELHFPVRWLDNPVDNAIHGMENVYTAMCARILGPGDRTADTAEQVRRLLLSRPGRKMLRLEEAAEHLRLSPTQLRKRLYRVNTSFKALVLEIRMELAKHYLLDTQLTVQEISYLLDYSQPAPFSRAFKLHCGLAPDQYRRANSTLLSA